MEGKVCEAASLLGLLFCSYSHATSIQKKIEYEIVFSNEFIFAHACKYAYDNMYAYDLNPVLQRTCIFIF